MKRSSRAIGWCSTCRKLSYTDRKTAKSVARQHHDDHKGVYECPVSELWHVGGVPDEVIRGEVSRSEYFGRAS